MRGTDFMRHIKKAREQGYKDGIKFSMQNYSAVLLLCLKDKFDFTADQLEQTAKYVNDTFDSVYEGYLTLNDIAEALKEEDDLDLSYNGVIVRESNDVSNQPLDKEELEEHFRKAGLLDD